MVTYSSLIPRFLEMGLGNETSQSVNCEIFALMHVYLIRNFVKMDFRSIWELLLVFFVWLKCYVLVAR